MRMYFQFSVLEGDEIGPAVVAEGVKTRRFAATHIAGVNLAFPPFATAAAE